jgi:hypothetical protein
MLAGRKHAVGGLLVFQIDVNRLYLRSTDIIESLINWIFDVNPESSQHDQLGFSTLAHVGRIRWRDRGDLSGIPYSRLIQRRSFQRRSFLRRSFLRRSFLRRNFLRRN